ncbi:MAG: hypothetical protein FJZ58_02175 [Chlamydiae bacterium]|nr:hypothetical protein [Chlamydiota bacterium]
MYCIARFFVVLVVLLGACSKDASLSHPFAYDLHMVELPGNTSHAMVCFHGLGGSYQIAEHIQTYGRTDATLVGFNFPDHSIRIGFFDPAQTCFGTKNELLPALYVLKHIVIEKKFQKVSLYGFSAGGGAVINALAILAHDSFTSYLEEVGISKKERKKILAAIERGEVLLDTPLKSLDEVLALHQGIEGLPIVAARYKENNLEPIDNIAKLQGLSLHFIVNFQFPDEILSNRDDTLYISKLKQLEPKCSVSYVIEGQGHGLPHPSLWQCYEKACLLQTCK